MIAAAMVTSAVAAVDRRHRQLRELDAVDAAHIQRHHLGSVGLAAAREHVDAAVVLLSQKTAVGYIENQLFEKIQN
jgi:hypothetical protein